MSQYTPGPWKACQDSRCPCRQIWSIPGDVPVFTAKPDKMAQVGLAHHKWGDGPTMLYGTIPLAETEANARLIAAAPEEHEVLGEILAWWNSLPNNQRLPNHDRLLMAIRKGRDAHAKAEGK